MVLGRPRSVSDAAVARARALRAEGLSYRAVADQLTTEGVPTGQRGRWHAPTVRKVLLAAARTGS